MPCANHIYLNSSVSVDATGVDDSGYLDMAPVSQSLPTVRERTGMRFLNFYEAVGE
jgi:hypothetical protein